MTNTKIMEEKKVNVNVAKEMFRDTRLVDIKGIPTQIYEHNDPSNPSIITGTKILSKKEVFTRLMQTLSVNQILPFIKLDYVLANTSFQDEMFPEDVHFKMDTDYGGSEGIYTDISYEDENGKLKSFITIKTLEEETEDYLKMLQIGGTVKSLLEKKIVTLQKGELRLGSDVIQENENYNSINEKSDNITVDGHIGTWYVIDTTRYYGKDYFLLEHEEYGDETACVIIDKTGALVAEDIWNGFEDENFEDEIAKQDEMLGKKPKQKNVEKEPVLELPKNYECVVRDNNTILCVNKKIDEYATWDIDNDGKGVNTGHYFADDKATAFNDFIKRSGVLESKNLLFSKDESVEIYKCLQVAYNGDYNLQDKDTKLIKNIGIKIEDEIPNVCDILEDEKVKQQQMEKESKSENFDEIVEEQIVIEVGEMEM